MSEKVECEARETIDEVGKQNKTTNGGIHIPVLALDVVLQLALDHANHDLVGNETTLVHDLLGLLAEVGLLSDLRTQHVSGSLVEVE
jgi:hypothetical protein